MKTGKTVVYLYEGTLPKSGKQSVNFADHTLVHRSVAKDKSDLLVHLESRIIVRAYPMKTDRSIILNDLADNLETLEHFLANPDEYEVQERPKVLKVLVPPRENVLNKLNAPFNLSYKDVDVVEPKFKQEYMLPLKKSYDVGESKWD